MDLSEKVKRYAEIKAEISELKSEADGIEADILKASEADLQDTKFKSAVYSDNAGNAITVTNADNVKLVYPTMLKEIFGKAYGDVVKEDGLGLTIRAAKLWRKSLRVRNMRPT